MKIGILTFHHAINFGAVLQAYALKETLRSFGHDVWVIDYRQPKVESVDRPTFSSAKRWKFLFGGHLRSWLNYNKEKEVALAKRKRFDDFTRNYLHLTSPCTSSNIPLDFDMYISGSDQVWNHRICGGMDDAFWGNFQKPIKSKMIAYAASTSVQELRKNTHQELQAGLNNFDIITVREDAVRDYLSDNFKTPNEIFTVLDPTLVADVSIWDSFESGKYSNKKYVLYFAARTYEPNPFIVKEKAEILAKELGCEAIPISLREHSPSDFVELFKHATYVVTSSFHGVAFSLIFNRPLYAVMYGDEQDGRYVNLLRSVGAEQMLLGIKDNPRPIHIDYTEINQKMESIRKNSTLFLRSLHVNSKINSTSF